MIQRIQTFWLLLIFFLSGCLFFLPAVKNEFVYTFFYKWLLNIEIGLTVILSTITIFLYKNRCLQIKLCAGIFVIQILLYLTLFFAVRSAEASITWNFPAGFPLIVMIFDVLAVRAIKKDEKLVHSLDRLR
jgi:hypothetical protein